MGRPTTKADLLELANGNFTKLWNLIDSMSNEEQMGTFIFDDRDRNLRDVLVHLYEWHQLLLKWVANNMDGNLKPFLPAPYNWKSYPTMNVEIWKSHQSTPYEDSKKMVKESHSKVIALIDSFTNEELFSKKIFSWTGTNALGSYCVSTTSSHYDWAIKKIKNHIKTFRDKEKEKK